MAASTLAIKAASFTDVDTSGGDSLDLVATTASGAIYRLSSRALALPLQVEFQYKIGSPGQKGNDNLKVIITNAVQNSSTKEVLVMRCAMDLSVPRDPTVFVDADVQYMLGYLASIVGKSAHRVAISNGSVV